MTSIRRSQSPKHQRGLTLVEVLVAAGILGIVAIAVATNAQQVFQQMFQIRLLGEIDEIRIAILNRVNCDASLDPPGATPGACAALGPAILRDTSGNVLVDAPLSQLPQGFQLRAVCADPDGAGPQPREIRVEFQKRKANGSVATDPVSGNTLSWRPLFDEGVAVCAARTQPRWVYRYADLKPDPLASLTYLIWAAEMIATGSSSVPVLVAADSYPDLWPTETSALYYGAARCPRGYTAVTGAVDCSGTPTGNEGIDPAPATSLTGLRRAGYKVFSGPAHELTAADSWMLDAADRGFKDVDYWYGACAIAYKPPIYPEPMSVRSGRVMVGCYRNADY